MIEKIVNVATGILTRDDGKILLGNRPEGKSWAGWWEFPGGKLEPGETALQALNRALSEELGIKTVKAYPWITYVYFYPKSAVRLTFFRIIQWIGNPVGLENQFLKWFKPCEIYQKNKLLPAIYSSLKWLKLPRHYGITSIQSPIKLNYFLKRLDRALRSGLKLIQFREPSWPDGTDSESLLLVLEEVVRRCHKLNAMVLINSMHPKLWWEKANGVHLQSHDAKKNFIKSENSLLCMSTHNHLDLIRARYLNADFAVLGPVLKTPTHPKGKEIGWKEFSERIKNLGIPVFALGGQSEQTQEDAYQHGAHGIAGIRFLI
ncbi:MAG: Nudix family hydrolase [Bordetella sp.]|nr:MAG: Nudix family hydrolase [Bordetella sp.]